MNLVRKLVDGGNHLFDRRAVIHNHLRVAVSGNRVVLGPAADGYQAAFHFPVDFRKKAAHQKIRVRAAQMNAGAGVSAPESADMQMEHHSIARFTLKRK